MQNLLSRSRWRQVDVSSDHGTDPLEGKLQGKPILDEPQWLSPETEYIQTDIFNLPQPYRLPTVGLSPGSTPFFVYGAVLTGVERLWTVDPKETHS